MTETDRAAGEGLRGLAAHARNAPDKIAVIDGDRAATYAQLYERVRELAAAMREAGASHSRPLALMLRNSLEFIIATQASALAATPYVPINWHLKTDEVAYILEDSQAAILICDADLAGYAEQAATRVEGCRMVVAGAHDVPSKVIMDTLTERDAWTAPTWLFYTSGTTGRPKGVVHGHGDADAVVRQQEGIVELWGFRSDDVYLLAGPGYHAGPGGYAGTTLYVGGTVVVMSDWDAHTAFWLIERHLVTVSFLTPAHFIRMLEAPEAERESAVLNSVRLIIHGGAPCPVEVKREILELLPTTEIGEVYGGSEGGGTKILRADWLAHPGSVGRPWPGAEIRILDESGGELSAGVDGFVYIKPANGARFHYHNDEEKTKSAWWLDAFSLGDIGHLDADGFLYLTGRSSDLVLWNGVNIYPREVEEVLHQHPAVIDCVVIGVPDQRAGESLAAVVELRQSVPDEELKAHCRAALADFKCPASFHHTDALPRDPNGKIRKTEARRELIQLMEQRCPDGPGP